MISKSAIDFYTVNKNFNLPLPPAPAANLNDYELSDWLLNQSDFGWLELDIEIDILSWKLESHHARYVDHRGEDHPGWNSCCIHGISADKTEAWRNYGYTDEKQVPYQWTEISEQTPTIKDFWMQFPYENYRRIRFMQLKAGSTISPHSDAPGRLPGEKNLNMLEFGVPINVAITHPKECFMTLEGHGVVPWQEGKAYIINIRNYHSVINFSNTERIHLIAHGIPGNRIDNFVKLVARSYRKNYG